MEVTRFGLAGWRVGLAAPPGSSNGWWEDTLNGSAPVIQREDGAGVQQTFEAARTVATPAPGPVVATHLEAAHRCVTTGLTAVTIEPAALAAGAEFHALDVHVAELWVDTSWLAGPQIGRALDTIGGRRFQSRLEAVGGYDLTGCGVRVA